MKKSDHIVFFDGVCTLCNASIDQLIRWDKKRVLRYASLQSDLAWEVLAQSFETKGQPDSIVFYTKGSVYVKSDAVIQIGLILGGIYSVLGLGKVLPRKLRNWLYDVVARNRYKWFGKRDTCRIPTAEESELILG